MVNQSVAREQEIVRILSEDRGKTVAEMTALLGVSAVTIRRDLRTLAEKGVVVRTHGGAFPSLHPSILERRRRMVAEKERIARAAAAQVGDGVIGTPTGQFPPGPGAG